MIDREAMQMALDVLEWLQRREHILATNRVTTSIEALRTALAQPEKEWVGLMDKEIEDCLEMSIQGTCRAIEAKLKEKNT